MIKQLLSVTDRESLDKRIADSESKTRAQIVLAVVRRSDSYVEIPWKAFAFGSSIAGFMVFLFDLIHPVWVNDMMILFSVTAILATGALFVILTLLVPGIARLFLSESRTETEVKQYAESLFLSRELFATESRRGILLLVSYFERKVVILPDRGIRDLLTSEDLTNIITKMKKHLRSGELASAMDTGLDEIVAALMPSASEGSDKNELSNNIIEEEGQ